MATAPHHASHQTACADNTKLIAPHVVHAPGPGQHIDVDVIANQPLIFDFNPLDAHAVRHGNDITLTFADGGEVVLHQIIEPSGPAPTPLELPDGTVLTVADLFNALNLGDILPAAGPNTPNGNGPGVDAGSGHVFTPFEPGDLGPGLNPLGPLGFSGIDRSAEFTRGAGGQFGIPSETPGTPSTPVTPPEGTMSVPPDVNVVWEFGTPEGTNPAGPATASNNLLTGAVDSNPSATINVTGITGTGGTASVSGATTIAGEYGTLTVNPNGTYTYTLDGNNATVQYLDTHQTLHDTFTYVASDGSLTDSSTLVITINGYGGPVPLDDHNSIANTALPDFVNGNVLTDNQITNYNTVPNTFTNFEVTEFTQSASQAGGNGTVANAGQTLTDQYGDVVTINSNGTYTFTLNESNATIKGLLLGTSIIDTFTYTASDALADNPTTGNADNTATANLYITINGEVCTLTVDPFQQTVYEDGTPTPGLNSAGPDVVTGNLLTGAVDTSPGAVVTVAEIGNSGGISVVSGATTINGQYGTLTVNPNGTYTYTLDNNNATVEQLETHQTLQETFTYVASDGTLSAASTLVVTIDGYGTPGPHDDANSIANDAAPSSVGGNVLTDNPITNGEPGTHTFTNFEVTQFAQGGNTAAAGGTLTDAYGDTLTINSNGTYTFNLNESNATIHNLGSGQSIVETFTYTASDALADNPTTGNADNTANANLVITITGTGASNENPSLAVDPHTNIVYEDGTPTPGVNLAGPDVVTDNLLGGAVDSSPSATVTVIDITGPGGTTAVSGATTINGQYGTLTVNPNGTYTYTLDNNNATVEQLETHQTLQETFTYVASDGSLDASSTLVVTIDGFGTPGPHDDANSITSTAFPNFVTGNVLTDNPITNGESGTHTFTNFEVTQFGQGGNTAAAGGHITDIYGDTLTIGSNGGYTFTLNESNSTIKNLLFGTSIIETFSYTASDALADNPTTGNADNTANANLYITINGEFCVITANPDAATLTVGTDTSATGNVLTNDTATDTASLVVSTFAYNGTTVAAGQTLTDNLGDTLTINANGTYTFTLNQSNTTISSLTAGQSIVETFTYTDKDDAATGSTSITFTISGASSGGDVVTSNAVHSNLVVATGSTNSGTNSVAETGDTSTGSTNSSVAQQDHHHAGGLFHFAGLDTIDLSHVPAIGSGAAGMAAGAVLQFEELLSGFPHGNTTLAQFLSGGLHAPTIPTLGAIQADISHALSAATHLFESLAPLHHPHPHAH